MDDIRMTEILLSAEYMQETTEVMEFLASLNLSEQREFFCFTQGLRYAQGQKCLEKHHNLNRRGGGVMVEVQGKFDTQRFFETLAAVIGKRENVKITMSVKEEEQQQESEEPKAS